MIELLVMVICVGLVISFFSWVGSPADKSSLIFDMHYHEQIDKYRQEAEKSYNLYIECRDELAKYKK